MGIPTVFAIDLVLSITGNNYLQFLDKARIYAYIVKRDVSVCSFDCHKTGEYENIMTQPVWLLT